MERVKSFRLIAACLLGLLVSTGYLLKVGRVRDQIAGFEQSAEVLAAARPLAIGERLAEGSLEGRRMPEAFVPRRALLPKDMTLIADQVLIHPVPAGEPVLWSDLADGPRQRRPTESIPDGFRSFCLPADEVHTQAHLLAGGDTVDILWTHMPEGSSTPRTEVLSRRTQVLAVGRAQTHEAASETRDTPSSVTLLVTPELGILLATCMVSGEITFVGRGRGALDEMPPARADQAAVSRSLAGAGR